MRSWWGVHVLTTLSSDCALVFLCCSESNYSTLICVASVGRVAQVHMLNRDDPGVPPEGLVVSSRVLRSSSCSQQTPRITLLLLLILLLFQELVTHNGCNAAMQHLHHSCIDFRRWNRSAALLLVRTHLGTLKTPVWTRLCVGLSGSQLENSAVSVSPVTAPSIINKPLRALPLKSAAFSPASHPPSTPTPLYPRIHEVGHWCHLDHCPMWPMLTWISGWWGTQLQRRAASPGPTDSNLSREASEDWRVCDAGLRVDTGAIVCLCLEGRDQGKQQVKCITATVTMMQTDCCQSSEAWFMSNAATRVPAQG